MRVVFSSMLLALSVGCAEGTGPSHKTANNGPTDVTVRRPVLTDEPDSVTTNEEATTDDVTDRTNTEQNMRDRDGTTKTPIDQNESQADINTTAMIRQKVVDLKMSVNSQNIKIITQNGMVTLRGPVESEEEKQRIEEIAQAVAGADKVDNQLEIDQK